MLAGSLDEVISEKRDWCTISMLLRANCLALAGVTRSGSNEFYMGYATSRQTACAWTWAFPPTELFPTTFTRMLYVLQSPPHVSRPVRWDSDHVVLLDDETGGDCQ
ncbi:L-rhamnose isomerase [Shigella sonnei]